MGGERRWRKTWLALLKMLFFSWHLYVLVSGPPPPPSGHMYVCARVAMAVVLVVMVCVYVCTGHLEKDCHCSHNLHVTFRARGKSAMAWQENSHCSLSAF